ncbi:BamA/TamA family outer membrane protein [Porticoccaceae bacterium]|nr:BamA/TamA family outer membrane protein [Porticoccaceae bacterium]
MLWGAGLGLRYYTSFAPIRFDIGVPLNQRAEIDDSFQIYISIGQAF